MKSFFAVFALLAIACSPAFGQSCDCGEQSYCRCNVAQPYPCFCEKPCKCRDQGVCCICESFVSTEAQPSLTDRLQAVESCQAKCEKDIADIKATLKEIKEMLKPQQTGVVMGPSFQPQAAVCGPQGCSPQAQQGPQMSQGHYESSGGLFSRLRDRRAARRGY